MIVAGKVYGKQNEFENMVVDLVDSLPTSPKTGQLVWDTTANTLYLYDGSSWISFLSNNGANAHFSTLIVDGNSDLGRHVRIRDEMVTLNYGETGAGISQYSTSKAGIEVARGTLPTVSLYYDENLDKWVLTNDGSNFYTITNSNDNGIFLRLDGTNSPTNDIGWGNNRLTMLGEPQDSTDAATKSTAIKFAIVLG